jgi:hypothetical protein
MNQIKIKNLQLNCLYLKKTVCFLVTLFFTFNVLAQTDSTFNNDKLVTLTVTSQGKTLDEAKTNALRSAIEQAFGAFISSNTTILNDSIIRDEVVSVSNGNIQKYEVMAENALPDGSFSTTLKVNVSVNKLTNYCQSKGIKIEFEGGLFAVNIKQKILNEEAEIKSIWNALNVINPILNQSFDYTIKSEEPLARGDDNNIWIVPMKVSVKTNKNITLVFEYLKETCKNLSMNESELKGYVSLNKKTFSLEIDSINYYFRRQETLDALHYFFNDFVSIMRSFIVSDGINNIDGHSILLNSCMACGGWSNSYNCFFVQNADYNCESEHYHPGCNRDNHDGPYSGFEGPSKDNYLSKKENEFLREYDFIKTYTLSDISKIKEFSVSPISKTSKLGSWYKGGRIFYIDPKNIAYICPINIEMNSYVKELHLDRLEKDSIMSLLIKNLKTDTSIGSGKSNSKILTALINYPNTPFAEFNKKTIQGYDDWFLPSQNEMIELLKFFVKYFGKAPTAGRCFGEGEGSNRDFVTSTTEFYYGLRLNSVECNYSIYGNPEDNKISLGGVDLFVTPNDCSSRVLPIRQDEIGTLAP